MLLDDIKTMANFIRELKGEVPNRKKEAPTSSSLVTSIHPWIGEKVIIRTESAGVHYGKLNYVDGSIVRLKNARRIWRWDGAFTLNEIAVAGLKKSDNCKFSNYVSDIELDRIEIILAESDGIKSIESIAPHEI